MKYLYFISNELGDYHTRAIARKVKKFHEELTGYRCEIDRSMCSIDESCCWHVYQTTTPLKGK